MNYSKVIQYLESFINYEKIAAYPYKESFKLERIKEFLNSIENPQDSLKAIHIAGTKGKGSTCAFIAHILKEAGYKVGLYTSPHLSDFRERIRILSPRTQNLLVPSEVEGEPKTCFEGMISQDELINLVERLKPSLQIYRQNSKYGELSFFEVYTALAFVYFKEKNVDFAVLETGLGGRLDATNVVNPYVCGITSISFEHTKQLGNTLEEIAKEKAGIIKKSKLHTKNQKLSVISAPQKEEAIEVIRNRCRQVDAKLYEVGKDITYQKTKDGFSVKGVLGEYPDLKIRLLGRHQLINATVAVGAMEALRFHNINPVRNTKAIISEDKISNGVNVDIDSMREGLYNTVWPGRCEILSSEPLVILDGAQNVASVKALKDTIKENFSAEGGSASGRKYKKLILVLGISKDKDIEGICRELYGLADEVILTRSNNPRAIETNKLVDYFKGKKLHLSNNVKEAEKITAGLAKREDLILVTGSLFVVGEYRDIHSRTVSSPEARTVPARGQFSDCIEKRPYFTYFKI